MSETAASSAKIHGGLQILTLSEDIGAEIRGLDLGQPMSDAAFGAVYQAWLDHQVLLFRGQS